MKPSGRQHLHAPFLYPPLVLTEKGGCLTEIPWEQLCRPQLQHAAPAALHN